MTNKELWEQYVGYTKDTSTIARSLAFGAIAVCWVFKDPDGSFPYGIFNALEWTVFFFIFDLAQYLISAILYWIWIRRAEKTMHKKTGSIEGSYDKPAWLDRPARIFWLLKIAALALAYRWIVPYVID